MLKDVNGTAFWLTGETVLPHIRVATTKPKGEPQEPQCSYIANSKTGAQWHWAACDEKRNSVCQVPTGFQDKLTGHGYRVSTAPLKYDDARKLCKRLGGALASVTSPREHALIEKLLSKDITTYPVLWIGASRAAPHDEFGWEDDSSFSWTNFAARQPDNYEGQQDCLALDQKNHAWHDRYCTSKYQSICEFDVLPRR